MWDKDGKEDSKGHQVDELVSIIDQFMAGQGGHMDVRVEGDGSIRTDRIHSKTITTKRSLDCASGNLSCRTPTLFGGMDDGEGAENQGHDN